MKKFSLFKKFTIYSLIAFIITGTVLGYFISNHIKNDKLKNVKDLTAMALDSYIKPELSPTDFEKTISEDKLKVLNLKLSQIKKTDNIIGARLWNAQKSVVYYDNPELIKRHFEDDQELTKALGNNIVLKVCKPHEKENLALANNYSEVIKIYIPIVFNDKVAGAFELYKPYDEIKLHIRTLNGIIILIMFLGLLTLYLFLLRVIYNASNTLVLQNESLLRQKNELEQSYSKLHSTYKDTIITLSNAIDARDPYTAGHSERVAEISVEIGKNLGLTKEQLSNLELSALFHDIGKLGVPDEILLKPGKLNDVEFKKIKEHPTIGFSILKNVDFLGSALTAILHHHERFSGGGYPDGIANKEIPLEARIIAVADTYDAITSDRPYRKGLSHEEAVSEIIKSSNTQLDPDVVEAFLGIEKSLFNQDLQVLSY